MIRNVSILLLGIIILSWMSARGEDRYWVYFNDKGIFENLSFHKQRLVVERHVTSRAMERRRLRGEENNATVLQYMDLPVDTSYLRQLEYSGFEWHATSRWMNAVSGTISAQTLSDIERLPFVKLIEPVRSWYFKMEILPSINGNTHSFPDPLTVLQDTGYGFSDFQIRFHNINLLHEKGLTGNGIVIGVFDTGFSLVNPSLRHIPAQLIAEYDFVQKDSVTSDQPGDPQGQDWHGTVVLSMLAGYLPDTLIGPAYRAGFLLAKTEIESQELHVEEDNWAMAAEWAESLGADIITSSLGYSTFDAGQGDYTYQDMDGETTVITRAANELARRGVLVVTSTGNEGGTPWRYITAPADGFYVLAVGSVNGNNQVSLFSSIGPTYDGRIKPDVVALGESVYGAVSDTRFGTNRGTSYSCPLAAGIAAQLLQQRSNLDLLSLLNILRRSGDTAAAPDNERGYGKIDALRAWTLLQQQPVPAIRNALPPVPNPYYINSGILFFPVDLLSPVRIQLEIYTLLGQKIRDIYYYGGEGRNLVPWNVRDTQGIPVAPGIYFYRLKTPDWQATGKLTIIF